MIAYTFNKINMVTNATEKQLQKALDTINSKYDSNVIFNRCDQVSKNRIRFTLRVKNSKKAGHRVGFMTNKDGSHRRLVNACWHVHGDLFDALFDIDKDIFIISGRQKITIDGGNWQDRNIGSIMNPLYFSEACECE